MRIANPEQHLLRYCRQIVMKAMDKVRTDMRGSRRLAMKQTVVNVATEKSAENLTKAIDRETEELMLEGLQKKLGKIPELEAFTVFSEELGIETFPEGADEARARWVVFMDPIDGTEFAEHLQGGWCLMAVYDRERDRVAAAVAGDIFLDRLYWASQDGFAECLDFTTHSWFKLDGGPSPKQRIEQGIRLNVLTTKVSRYRAVANQTALLDALAKHDGRINLAWGSNTILQVAAGYADVALEFDKGFAHYDILPGMFIAEKAGLAVLDLQGNPLPTRLDIDDVFATYRRNPKNPKRTPFVVAKHPELARQVASLVT